jgi:WD40 repeat protein
VVVCGQDGDAHVVSLAEKRELFSVKHGSDLQRAFFDWDQQRLYTVGKRSIGVWKAASGAPLTCLKLPEIDGCLLTPQGNSLLLRTNDRAVFCDALTGELSRSMPHGDSLTHTALSRDGKWVLTSSIDKSARVWSAATGAQVTAMTHTRAVNWSAFSEDNLLVATASADQTARVWDARTGEPVSPPLVHPASVVFVDFRNHGKELVTVTVDGLIRTWRLDDDSSKHNLLLRARITSGNEMDQNGSVKSLKTSDLKSDWDELQRDTQPPPR